MTMHVLGSITMTGRPNIPTHIDWSASLRNYMPDTFQSFLLHDDFQQF